MTTPREEDLEALIAPIVVGSGYELVRIRLGGAKSLTLQIMAERADGTMTAEDCATLSRAISAMLDERDPLPEAYALEVSSPGIDRPLTRRKDYERWAGFAARVDLTVAVEGKKRLKGVLAGIEGDDVLIDLDGEEETALIPFHLIAGSKLVLTDELITESLRRAKAAGRQPVDETVGEMGAEIGADDAAGGGDPSPDDRSARAPSRKAHKPRPKDKPRAAKRKPGNKPRPSEEN